MTLSDLKSYLQTHGRAGLQDLAVHFRSSPDAVSQAMRIWENKGRVRRQELAPSCSSASGCRCAKSDVNITYEWIH